MTVYKIHAVRVGEFNEETHQVPTTREEFLVEAEDMTAAIALAHEDDGYEIEAIIRVGNIVERQPKKDKDNDNG